MTIKSSRKLVAVSILGILGALIWSLLRSDEPSFEGKRLSVWLEGYDGAWDTPQRKKADEAVRHLGTNALPTLLRLLQQVDTPSRFRARLIRLAQKQQVIRVNYISPSDRRRRAMMGITALGAKAKAAVPALIDLYEHAPAGMDRNAIAVALAGIGPEARTAVPALLRALNDSDLGVRRAAAGALGRIHAEPNVVVPELIRCLSHTNTYFKQTLAYALEGFGTNARPAVPALQQLLQDPDSSVRRDASRALKHITAEAVAEDLK